MPAQWTMCVAPRDELVETLGVEHVTLDEVEVRVLGEARPAERVPVQVVDGDDLVRVHEPARERRADEAGSAGDDDSFAAQGHAASLGGCSREGTSSYDAAGSRIVATWLVALRSLSPQPAPPAPSAETTLKVTYWANRRDRRTRERRGRCAATLPAERVARPARRMPQARRWGRKLFAPVPRARSAPRSTAARTVARVVGHRGRGARVGDVQPERTAATSSRWNRFSPWLLPAS